MKRAYVVMGVLLIAAGVAGFFQNPALGLFEVNGAHNMIHIGSGALTIIAGLRGIGAVRTWGRVFGLFYLALAIAGAVPGGNLPGLMHVDMAVTLLHVSLALFFLYYGLLAPPAA